MAPAWPRNASQSYSTKAGGHATRSIPREDVPVVIDDNGVEVRLRDEDGLSDSIALPGWGDGISLTSRAPMRGLASTRVTVSAVLGQLVAGRQH